jgi:hypothetical protein
MCPINLAS